MKLGALIAALEREDQNLVVPEGFGTGHSWRGNYSELAFTPQANVTVGAMLKSAKEMMGATIYGWKGGQYEVYADTCVNIAASGDYSEDDPLTQSRLGWMLKFAKVA